jgi:hypothetical protein
MTGYIHSSDVEGKKWMQRFGGDLLTCKPRNEVVGNSQVNLGEIHFEDEKWMYLAQGCVQSWAC